MMTLITRTAADGSSVATCENPVRSVRSVRPSMTATNADEYGQRRTLTLSAIPNRLGSPSVRPEPAPPPSPGSTAKDRRRLARMVDTVTGWWQPLPDADRLPYYSPEAIERATGARIQALAPALRALGWERAQVRIAGPAYIVWVAPGAKNPLRPIGRPRTRPTPTTNTTGALAP